METTGPADEGGCQPGQIDINTAGRDALMRIVHIDDARAGQLIRLRPFTRLDELTRIRGIGPVRLRDIREQGIACVP